MKKLLLALCMVSLAGCAQVKDAAHGAMDQLEAPPDAVLEALKNIGQFLIDVLLGFLTHSFGPVLNFLGL